MTQRVISFFLIIGLSTLCALPARAMTPHGIPGFEDPNQRHATQQKPIKNSPKSRNPKRHFPPKQTLSTWNLLSYGAWLMVLGLLVTAPTGTTAAPLFKKNGKVQKNGEFYCINTKLCPKECDFCAMEGPDGLSVLLPRDTFLEEQEKKENEDLNKNPNCSIL